MRMQLATIFLVKVLSCLLLLCLCSGAPPKNNVKAPASPKGKIFTPQEDELIINELLNLPDDYHRSRGSVWKVLEKKIHQRYSSGNPGFPQERSAVSLRCHFARILTKDRTLMERFPEDIMEKLGNRRKKGATLLGSSSTSNSSENQQTD